MRISRPALLLVASLVTPISFVTKGDLLDAGSKAKHVFVEAA